MERRDNDTNENLFSGNAVPDDKIVFVTVGTCWKVQFRGILDVFLTKEAAITFAYTLIEKHEKGEILLIKVTGGDGVTEIVWTYKKK